MEQPKKGESVIILQTLFDYKPSFNGKLGVVVYDTGKTHGYVPVKVGEIPGVVAISNWRIPTLLEKELLSED